MPDSLGRGWLATCWVAVAGKSTGLSAKESLDVQMLAYQIDGRHAPRSMMTALTISVIPTVSASLARNDRVHTSRVINSSLRVTGLMAFPGRPCLWALAEPFAKLYCRTMTASSAARF